MLDPKERFLHTMNVLMKLQYLVRQCGFHGHGGIGGQCVAKLGRPPALAPYSTGPPFHELGYALGYALAPHSIESY